MPPYFFFVYRYNDPASIVWKCDENGLKYRNMELYNIDACFGGQGKRFTPKGYVVRIPLSCDCTQ